MIEGIAPRYQRLFRELMSSPDCAFLFFIPYDVVIDVLFSNCIFLVNFVAIDVVHILKLILYQDNLSLVSIYLFHFSPMQNT